MGRKKGADDEMLQAAWDWAAELNKASGHALQISIVPTTRHGVFTITVRALEVVDGKAKGIALQISASWPDAEGVPFAAKVLQLLMELDHELAQPLFRSADAA